MFYFDQEYQKQPPEHLNPYKKEYHLKQYLWKGMKGKTVQYMLCFPQLYELIFKHETVPYIGSFASNQEFLERMWLYGYENGNLTIQQSKLNVKNQDINSYKTPNGILVNYIHKKPDFNKIRISKNYLPAIKN